MSRRAGAVAAALFALSSTACGPDPDSDAPAFRVSSVSAPPIDLPLPEFELIDHTGAPFTRASMEGSVFVVDFIFTSCPRVCPELTKTMAAFSKRVRGKPGVKFLSISVDPTTDTPERLTAFKDKYGDPEAPWFFVTGDPKVIDETVLRGFKMAMSRGTDGGHGDAAIFHAERFVVIDKKTHLRGVFDATAPGLDGLEKKLDELLAE